MVYQCVKAGKNVSWIIRKSGKGPAGLMQGTAVGRYANPVEFALSRLSSGISLSGLKGAGGWWYRFLFRTRIGRWLYGKIDSGATNAILDVANFQGRPGAKDSFKDLAPDTR